MEGHGASKSRSFGIDTKAHQFPTNAKLRRPSLGERHKSAPSVARRRKSHAQQPPDGSKSLDVSARSSKAGSRKGSMSSSLQLPETARRPSQNSDPGSLPLLKLVVLGNSQVGKTEFIRQALEIRKSNSSSVFSGRVSLAGVVYRVQLTELDLDDVEIEDGDHVSWPKYVSDLPFSSPDAVICLYDITDKDSFTGIPQFLSALSNLDTPVQLVASKTDAPLSDHKFDADFVDKVHRTFPHVQIAERATKSADHAKKCLLVMLKLIMSEATSEVDASPHVLRSFRERAFRESTTLGNFSHTRISDFSLRGEFETIPRPEASESGDDVSSETSFDGLKTATETSKALMRLQTTDLDSGIGLPRAPHTPVSESEHCSNHDLKSVNDRVSSAIPQTPESYYTSTMTRPGTSGTADSRAHQTFYHLDDESPIEESPPKGLAIGNLKLHERGGSEGGLTFSELVDKLLQLPHSKNDLKFAPAFLCLYRLFATPTRLMIAIMNRFLRTEKSDLQQLAKVAELLRYLQVMAQWTALYPGDFAGTIVRDLATTFVRNIEENKNLGPAAKEISNNLQVFVRDDDQDWTYQEKSTSNKTGHSRSESQSAVVSHATRSTENGNQSGSEDETGGNQPTPKNPSSASTGPVSLRSNVPSSQSATNLAALEHARDQAKKVRLVPHIPLSKVQWHLFMEIPTDELARELTRIDWTMYSAIRSRDFVRHNILPHPNISAMIKHFNHLANFVAGLILLRDKPKHRAKALEKFMDLAWKVRQLNNYNSLSALVAGITSHEVGRLGQTFELVPAEVKKQFMRLTVLMGNSKSYAAYRMAWENSFAERIPFIAALLRDLKLASDANSTFVSGSGKINWKKFEIMGDPIVSIQRSYEHPYTFPDKSQRTQEMARLILETKVIDEAQAQESADPPLWLRSVQVEPPLDGNNNNNNKKKFDWLRR